MPPPEPTLLSLAASISEAAQAITTYLEEHGHSAPSFSENGLDTYPKDPKLTSLRFQLMDAASDMRHLALGPTDFNFLQPLFWNHDTMTVDILNQFDFWKAVPVGGSATYDEIARKTTLPESIVRRVIRHSTTMRLFEEKPPGSGTVVHTSTTAYVAKHPEVPNWIGHSLEDARPGTVYVPQSLQRFSAGREKASEEVLQSGVAISDFDRTGRPTPLWEFLSKTPEGKPEGHRAHRFSDAMKVAAQHSPYKTEEILAAFDWGSLGAATVVDVGGSAGHDAEILARVYPELKFVVQDVAENKTKFESSLPPDLASRISFQVHDFFTPQPISAEVYFLKFILHDWPNKDAAKILQNLLSNFKPGARILLCENVLPPQFDEEGNFLHPTTVRRMHSVLDLQMLTEFNSLERSRQDWEALIKEVDERCVVRSILARPGALQSIIEIIVKD